MRVLPVGSDRLMLVATQTVRRPHIQWAAGQRLGQLLENAFGAYQASWFLVLDQELIQKFGGDGVFRSRHGVSGSER